MTRLQLKIKTIVECGHISVLLCVVCYHCNITFLIMFCGLKLHDSKKMFIHFTYAYKYQGHQSSAYIQ